MADTGRPWDPFVPTWEAWKKPVDLDRHIDTDLFRQGWPKPTIYREHEVIHVLCNLLDKALEQRVRVARCENYLEIEDRPCEGVILYRPGDLEAPCLSCGGRCGYLVATYIDKETP